MVWAPSVVGLVKCYLRGNPSNVPGLASSMSLNKIVLLVGMLFIILPLCLRLTYGITFHSMGPSKIAGYICIQHDSVSSSRAATVMMEE